MRGGRLLADALPVPPGGEPRTGVHALMRVEGREVSVYLTHLTHPPFRDRTRLHQSVFISELLARDPRPRILMGDVRLDSVLACDAFTPLRSRVPRVDASDHFPVVADVRLKAAP